MKILTKRVRDAIGSLVRGTEHDAPLPFPSVDLFYWRPVDGRINFGDHLSAVIVSSLLAKHQLTLEDEVSVQRRLLGIGSILHFCRPGDVVWGSGINGKIDPKSYSLPTNIDVRAVRGPLTAEVLRKRGIQVPDVFGDPGLLIKHLFGQRFMPSAQTDVLFVPNLHDIPKVPNGIHWVSPTLGWNRVVAEIVKAKLVLASSLHGLVIAESFGIPARYVRLSETEDLFKYRDYYAGSGRGQLEFATGYMEGLEMGGAPAPRWEAGPLLQSFPLDLWRQ